jgi:hypothetical protein
MTTVSTWSMSWLVWHITFFPPIIARVHPTPTTSRNTFSHFVCT